MLRFLKNIKSVFGNSITRVGLAITVFTISQTTIAQTITGISVPGATANGSGTTWDVKFVTSSATSAGYKAIDISMNNTKGEYIVFDDTSASSDWEVVQGQPHGGSWFPFCKTMLVNDNACTGNCTMTFYIRNIGTTNGTFKNSIKIALGTNKSNCTYNTSTAYTLGITVEKVSATGIYTWIGTHGSGDSTWGQADNWSPTRTTPSTSDVLVVDLGSNTNTVTSTIDVSGVTESISQFRIYNYNNVVFKCTTNASTLTVGNGAIGPDFLVDSFGSFMNSGNNTFNVKIDGSNNLSCLGKLGTLSGTLKFTGTGNHTVSNTIRTTAGTLAFQPASGLNTLYLNGTSQSIEGTSNGTFYIDSTVDVRVGRNSSTTTLTLNRPLKLYSALKFFPNTTIASNVPSGTSASAFNAWEPNLQLKVATKPGALSRGQIDTIPSTSTITGGALFEIKGTNVRSYRLFGIPLKNGVSLSQFSDNIDITGTYSGDNRDSFSTTCTYCVSSAFTWNESTQSWVAYASGNTGNVVPHGTGIMMFYRGTKANGLGNPSADANTNVIDFKGQLFSGSKTVNLNYNSSGTDADLRGLNLVVNPYPCAIDFNHVGKPSGFKQKFKTYDGRAKTYNTWDSTISNNLTRNGSNKFKNSQQNLSRIVEAGASFFVYASGTGESLVFEEHDKVSKFVSATDHFKVSESNIRCNELSVGIRFKNDSVPENDNALLQLDMNYPTIVKGKDGYDDPKLYGGFLGVGPVSEDGVWMSIDRRPAYTEESFVIPLKVKTPENNNYRLTFDLCDENKMRYKVELFDRLLNKTTTVSDNIEYGFYKTKTDSLVDNRFELLFTEIKQPESGLNELLNESLVVFPNPSKTGMFKILNKNHRQMKSMRVFSMAGQEILNRSKLPTGDVVELQLNLKGMYLLRLETEDGTMSKILINE